MLDSGNFVLYDKDSKFIWQSFDYPTDTILGDQALFTEGQLLSSLSESDHSTGRFHLVMLFDGNLISYPANSQNDGAVSMVDGVRCWVCGWGADHFGRRSSWRIFLQNIFGLVVRYFWIDLVVWSFKI